MRRLVLMASTVVFGYGLAIGEVQDRQAAGLPRPGAPSLPTEIVGDTPPPPFDPGGPCPTNPAYPAMPDARLPRNATMRIASPTRTGSEI